MGEQRIAGNIERNAEEDVGAALVELEIEPARRDLGLEQAVAGSERHLRDLAGVPGGDDLPARRGVPADQLDEARNLVDVAAARRLPVAPLLAVDGAKVAVLVGPF